MASNLNKAFMRAYAKDRPANQEAPAPTPTSTPSAPLASPAVQIMPTSPAAAHSATAHAAPSHSATTQPTANPAFTKTFRTPASTATPSTATPSVATPSMATPTTQAQPIKSPVNQLPPSQAQSRPAQPTQAQAIPAQSTLAQPALAQPARTAQPPVFSGRYVATTTPATMNSQSPMQREIPLQRQPASRPQTSSRAVEATRQTHVDFTPKHEAPTGNSPLPASMHAPIQAPAAAARPIASHQPTNRQSINHEPANHPSANHPSTNQQSSNQQSSNHQPGNRQSAPQVHAQASGVWQRIDQAQASPTPHLSASPARPTASVAAVAAPPARRLQAAATPPKPNPSIAASMMPPVNPIAHKIGDSEEELPVISDQELALVDKESLQTKRRTVADFLYAAGQYTPGRILAGHPAHASSPAPTAAAHATVQPVMNSPVAHSQPVQSQPTQLQSAQLPPVTAQPAKSPVVSGPRSGAVRSSASMSAVKTTAAPTMSAAMAPTMTPSSMPAAMPIPMPTEITEQPAISQPEIDQPIAEPMPRRMGQILRVDVPRGTHHTASTTNTRAQVATAPAAPSMQSATEPDNQASGMKAPEVDVAARYVLEQRRIDRAHQISEMEEKLRQDAHKVFNPVWEVDRLQWPSVVDKLMQHRAESMAQVAAHMKAACQDGLSVLGVTSAGKGEGRTTVACCLARLAASHGLNVCLVDLDLDHPTLCIQTNMEVEHDWRDCLTSELTLEEVAVHSLEDHLTILPLKPRGGRAGLLASDSRLADMLSELAASFELVVVDCSKINSAGNVISGLTHANIFNAAILVVDRRDSQQSRIEDAVYSIQNSGIESIGIVDNFAM